MTSFLLKPRMLSMFQERCYSIGVSMADVLRLAVHKALLEDEDSLLRRVLDFNVGPENRRYSTANQHPHKSLR